MLDLVNDCVVYKIPTPDGELYLTIIEDKAGNPIAIRIGIGKAGTTVRAYTESLMLIINKFLEKGGTLFDIIEALSSTTSSRITYTHKNVPIRSGAEGIVYGLIRYVQSKNVPSEYELPRIRKRSEL